MGVDFQPYSSSHVVTGEDWNQLLDHGLEKPVSYVVRNVDGVVEAVDGRSGKREFSGSSLPTVLGSVFNALPMGRTWKERVVVKGEYTLDDSIMLADYVVLDLYGARLKLADDVDKALITASGRRNFAVLGGHLDGNRESCSSYGISIEGGSTCGLVRDVTVENTAGAGVLVTDGDTGKIKVQNCRFKNTGHGVFVMKGASYVDVLDCWVENPSSCGFGASGTEGAVSHVNFINCRVDGGGYNAIWLYFNVYHASVIGCEVKNVTFGWGIEVENAMYCILMGNHIHDCPVSHGIKLGFESSFQNAVIGNVIRNVGRHGIVINTRHTTVVGNTVENASASEDGRYDGICLGGSDGGNGEGGGSLGGNIIMGNIIWVRSGNRIRHGIREYGSYDNNIIKNNIILGEPTNEKILWVGGHTVVEDNVGARTENSGEATIPSGQSTVTFNHNIEGVAADGSNLIVLLGPKHSEVSDAVWSANDTQITITVPNPVSADRKISWSARRTS